MLVITCFHKKNPGKRKTITNIKVSKKTSRDALRDGCTKAKIARAVRTRVFGPWDGVGKSDATYKKIKSTLLRIHNDMRNGKFDGLDGVKNNEEYQKVLSSKSVKVGARGLKEGTKVVPSAENSTKSDDLTAPDLPSLNANEL